MCVCVSVCLRVGVVLCPHLRVERSVRCSGADSIFICLVNAASCHDHAHLEKSTDSTRASGAWSCPAPGTTSVSFVVAEPESMEER